MENKIDYTRAIIFVNLFYMGRDEGNEKIKQQQQSRV